MSGMRWPSNWTKNAKPRVQFARGEMAENLCEAQDVLECRLPQYRVILELMWAIDLTGHTLRLGLGVQATGWVPCQPPAKCRPEPVELPSPSNDL